MKPNSARCILLTGMIPLNGHETLMKRYFSLLWAILQGPLAMILATGIVFYPHLQHSGFLVWNDWHVHVLLLQEFTQQWQAGILYPRWVGSLNAGAGAPVFLYYSPLPYYLGAWLNMIVQDSLLTLKIAYGCSILGMGLGCYYLLRRILAGQQPLAILGAIGCIALPQFLLLSYPFNAYPVLIAWNFIPWVLYGCLRLSHWHPGWIAFTAFMSALTLLAHIVSAAQLFVMIGVSLLGAAIFIPSARPRLVPIMTSLLLGMIMAAFYWLPAWQERHLIHIDYLLDHLTYARQFLFLGWRDSTIPFANIMDMLDQMNMLLVISLWALLYAGAFIMQGARWVNAFMGLVIFLFYLMTPLSKNWWHHWPILQYMEFPWRWQTWFGFCTIALLVVLIQQGQSLWHSSSGSRPLLLALLGWALLPLGWLWFYYSPVVTTAHVVVLGNRANYLQAWSTPEDHAVTKNLMQLATWWKPLEYRPMTAGPHWQRQIADDHRELFEVLQGVAYIHQYQDQGSRKRWIVSVGDTNDPGPAKIRYQNFYFPGWELQIDGVITPIMLEAESGMMLFEAPAGVHSVQLVFKNTPIREWAGYLSGLGWLLMLVLGGISMIGSHRWFTRNHSNNAPLTA